VSVLELNNMMMMRNLLKSLMERLLILDWISL